MKDSKLPVLFVTSEVYPLIKTGGLADVSAALPNALRNMGIDIRLLLPGYPVVLEQLSLIEVHENIRVFPLQEPVRLLAGIMPDGITPVYVVECPALYEREGGPYQDTNGKSWYDNSLRFGILSKIAAKFGQHHFLFKPQLIHCNDWQTGLVPAFLNFDSKRQVKTLMTIHNMAYQGVFGPEIIALFGLPPESFNISGLEYYGQVSFLKSGLYYSDWISTVSPTYAKEIQTPEYGCGLEGLLSQRQNKLSGILNGIDTIAWNPESDPNIKNHYSIKKVVNKKRNTLALRTQLNLAPTTAPLLGIITRLAEQKGIDLLIPIIPQIIKSGAQIVILGSGDKGLESSLENLAKTYPKQMSVNIGYDEKLAHQIEAAANMFLMPSKFEPCGLNQIYSMRYGTIPIVRRTGGLADTVIDATLENIKNKTATGFVFDKASSDELLLCIQRALKLFHDDKKWTGLQINAMSRDFSWNKRAEEYSSLYQKILN